MFMLKRIRSAVSGAGLVLALAVAAAGALQAGTTVTYSDDGRALFRFEAPDFWTVRTGGTRSIEAPGSGEMRLVERVIGLRPTADPKVWVGFVAPGGAMGFSGAEKYLGSIGPFILDDAEVERIRRLTIGGRPARAFDGRGRYKRRQVAFTALAIALPERRMAIAVVVLEPGAAPGEVAAINAMLRSFRAIEQGGGT